MRPPEPKPSDKNLIVIRLQTKVALMCSLHPQIGRLIETHLFESQSKHDIEES